jgi:hypothetical protein
MVMQQSPHTYIELGIQWQVERLADRFREFLVALQSKTQSDKWSTTKLWPHSGRARSQSCGVPLALAAP